MEKVKHEIDAALIWLEEGNVERAKLHLGFALAHLSDEEAQQSVQPTLLESPRTEVVSCQCGLCKGSHTTLPQSG